MREPVIAGVAAGRMARQLAVQGAAVAVACLMVAIPLVVLAPIPPVASMIACSLVGTGAGIFLSYRTLLDGYPRLEVLEQAIEMARKGTLTLSDAPPRQREVGLLLDQLVDVQTHWAETAKELELGIGQLEAVVNNAGEAVVVTDHRGVIDTFNRNAEFLFEVTAGAAIGQPVIRYFGTIMRELDDTGSMQLGNSNRLDMSFERSDGEIIRLEVTASLIHGPQNIRLCLIARDVTSQLELEHLRVSEAQSAGMARVAAEVMHNIGNVLTALTASAHSLAELARRRHGDSLFKVADLLRDASRDPDAFFASKGKLLPDYLRKIGAVLADDQFTLQQESEHLERRVGLIESAVEAQRRWAKTAVVADGFDVGAVVSESVHVIRPTCDEASVSIVYEPFGEWMVFGDKTQLAHVFLNLMRNAVEAMEDADERILTVQVGFGNDQVVVRISDTGMGISKGDIPKLFQQGHTTKETGSGIGLHFCANAVHADGGEVTVQSEGVGQGATFVVTLPLMNLHDERIPVEAPNRGMFTPSPALQRSETGGRSRSSLVYSPGE